jgi:hypothetical protein
MTVDHPLNPQDRIVILKIRPALQIKGDGRHLPNKVVRR